MGNCCSSESESSRWALKSPRSPKKASGSSGDGDRLQTKLTVHVKNKASPSPSNITANAANITKTPTTATATTTRVSRAAVTPAGVVISSQRAVEDPLVDSTKSHQDKKSDESTAFCFNDSNNNSNNVDNDNSNGSNNTVRSQQSDAANRLRIEDMEAMKTVAISVVSRVSKAVSLHAELLAPVVEHMQKQPSDVLPDVVSLFSLVSSAPMERALYKCVLVDERPPQIDRDRIVRRRSSLGQADGEEQDQRKKNKKSGNTLAVERPGRVESSVSSVTSANDGDDDDDDEGESGPEVTESHVDDKWAQTAFWALDSFLDQAADAPFRASLDAAKFVERMQRAAQECQRMLQHVVESVRVCMREGVLSTDADDVKKLNGLVDILALLHRTYAVFYGDLLRHPELFIQNMDKLMKG